MGKISSLTETTYPLTVEDFVPLARGGANKKYRAGSSPDFINVFDFLTPSERADVRARTRALDVTASVAAALAAIPSTGAEVYFPPGRYKTTGGFGLPYPFRLRGGGSTSYDMAAGITEIECVSTSAILFDVSAKMGKFCEAAMLQSGGTATAGSAVHVSSAYTNQRVDFEDILVDGFYDGIDIAVGESWHLTHSKINDSVRYGVRVRNTVNADAGDWTIEGCNIYPAANAVAGIRHESSGGGRILSNKIIANAGHIQHGISLDYTGAASVQTLIIGNDIEGVSGSPIDIVKGWPYIEILGNFLNANAGGPVLTAIGCGQMIIADNICLGDGAAAFALTTCSLSTIGQNQYNSFTSPVSGTVASNVVDFSAFALTVANLPSATNVPVGTRAFVTDATATTFASTVAGGGSNKVPVYSDGTNWKIG